MLPTANQEQLRAVGWRALERGEVGCLLVAGGQGTRLGYHGPKGCFPLSPLKHKSLFQLYAERCVAASKAAGQTLPLAIMTSPLALDEIRDFFAEHENFGLGKQQVQFFAQSTLPVLDDDGNTITEAPGGNGWALKHLYDADLWSDWERAGIKSVLFCQIDNPLMDPFNPPMLGLHLETGAEVTIQAICRDDPDEAVGILMPEGDSWRVVEYSEVDPELSHARDEQNNLRFPYANISSFCFSTDFIRRLATRHADSMPLHKASKVINGFEDKGRLWKQERFIFDVLPFATNCQIYPAAREDCFAPLKSSEGKGSPDAVRQAMQEYDTHIFERLTGQDAPRPIELDPEFYYVRNPGTIQWRNEDGYIHQV